MFVIAYNKEEPRKPGGHGSKNEPLLIARACDGDSEAFCDLIEPYERLLFASAVAVLNNEEDAKDAVQNALLKACLNMKFFRGDCKFSTWLTQIVINEARMIYRRAYRRLSDPLDEFENDAEYVPREIADWRDLPLERLEQSALRRALQIAMDSLDVRYRTVAVLRDVEGFSVKETATILGLSEECVKTRLVRARLMLRDKLYHWRPTPTNQKERPSLKVTA